MARLRLPRPLLIFLFGLTVFVLGAAITLGGVAYAYKDKYYPGVQVGGLALSGKTKLAGEQVVAAEVSRYLSHPVVVTIPKISETPDSITGQYPDLNIASTAGDLGIGFGQQTALDNAWKTGHQRNIWQWTKTAFRALFSGYHQPLLYSIDQSKVESFVQTKVTPLVTTPVPPKIVIRGSVVAISDQIPGLTIDTVALTKSLGDSLATAVDKDTTYLRAPTTLADSPVARTAVEPIAAQLDKLGSLKVRLTTSSMTLAPTREQLLGWFVPVQDDKGVITLSLNQDAITSYLTENGKSSLDNHASTTSVVAALSLLLKPTVTDAQYAKTVYVSLTPKPTAVVTPGNYTLGEYPGKYIEINLSEQKMYLINGNNLEQTYLVSSGYWSTPTPKGRFHIASKSPRAYSAAFGLYMPYWQNFLDDNGQLAVGDYGIHGLPEWPNGYKEGANHLGIPVSHGCVRLGVGPDAYVYNWTETGTPIIIN